MLTCYFGIIFVDILRDFRQEGHDLAKIWETLLADLSDKDCVFVNVLKSYFLVESIGSSYKL